MEGGGVAEVSGGTDARYSAKVWGLDCNVGTRRWRSVMAYATPAERLHNYALVCVAFVPGTAAVSVKTFAVFDSFTLFSNVGVALPADRAEVSLALDRVEAARRRFPALTGMSITLNYPVLPDVTYFWRGEDVAALTELSITLNFTSATIHPSTLVLAALRSFLR